jgi:hypothetical protein
MKIDIDKLSDQLASDPAVTDYEFWRALRIVNDEIFKLGRSKEPVPMEFLQLRAVLRKARAKRKATRREADHPPRRR